MKFYKKMIFFLAVFISFCDLEKDSLASFDVKVAAACLVVHCGAYSSACSGSEIEVEWSGTVVAVFDNAVFGWDWFFHWYIIIGRCESDQKSQHWNDFHGFLWCFDINGRRSGRFDTLNIFWSPYIVRMRHNIDATGALEG